MKNKQLIALIAAFICVQAVQCRSEAPNVELWYKGVRNPAKDKAAFASLPTLYFTAGTLDDFEHKIIDPFNLTPLYKGSRKALSLDPSKGRRIILSDKQHPTINDEIDVITFGPQKTIYVRLRAIEPKDKPPFTIGPFKGKKFMMGPQTGKLKGILGKTESGYSLRNNIKTADMTSQRKKVRDILPYVVPGPPPPPKPTPKPEEAPASKKGVFELYNKTSKPVYFLLSDDNKPLSKTTAIKGTLPSKGGTKSGYFNDSGSATMYISQTPFKDLKNGQEVTYFQFLPNKDLFLVAVHDYDGTFTIRSYRGCGVNIPFADIFKRVKRADWVISRCKKYGIHTYQILKVTGTHRGGAILKKAPPAQAVA